MKTVAGQEYMFMNNIRVLLINPVCWPSLDLLIEDSKRGKVNADEPLGLASIVSWIATNLPEVEIKLFDHHIAALRVLREPVNIDTASLWQLLQTELDNFQPDIVGLSGLYHMNAGVVHETARIIKEIVPDSLLVMGGMYPTSSPAVVFRDPLIDWVVSGEGEIPFQHLLEHFLGRRQSADLQSVFRKETTPPPGQPGHSTIFRDVDMLPLPSRDELPIGEYSIWGRNAVDRFYRSNMRVAALQSSRGCPFSCTYCTGHLITGRNYRTRSPQSVVDEIRYLRDTHDIQVVTFNDEIANCNQKWSTELYQKMIDARLGVKWMHGGGFYVHLMDDQLIEKAIESGLIMFNLAIESGSKTTLKRVQKAPEIITSAPRVVAKIRQFAPDIYINGFFMGGFPWETTADLQQTIDFSLSLDLDWVQVNIFQPFPGSALFQYCVDNGHLKADAFAHENLLHYLNTQLLNTVIPACEVEERLYHVNLQANFVNSRSIRLGRYQQAIRDYQRVVEVAPDHALAHWCLSVAYENSGSPELAQQERTTVRQVIAAEKQQAEYFRLLNVKL